MAAGLIETWENMVPNPQKIKKVSNVNFFIAKKFEKKGYVVSIAFC
jgi:hypothetical protein